MLLALAYAIRVWRAGRARHARVDKEGGGPLVGRRPMEMVYWGLGPLGRACAALHVSAAAITWVSLALGVGAGLAAGAGSYGVAALLGTVSFLGDAVDEMVARLMGTASDQGELLDAAVDRYVELLLFGGLLVSTRGSVLLLAATFVALAASVMVSYVTAKAEALRVDAPRGIMRRTERATLLTLALTLTPIVAYLQPRFAAAPLAAALIAVGVLGNVSSVTRLAAISRVLGERRLAAPSPPFAADPAHRASEVP